MGHKANQAKAKPPKRRDAVGRYLWLRRLKPGDEVWWDDPDRGLSSGYYTIVTIGSDAAEFPGDSIVSLKSAAGSEAEVFASEIR
ncbi:MAG: hypothetical protein EPN36_13865 [Rhodanobacteraceae bacterium]|nr:MAG: hypothetical protein EPN36_13865 [Rhodanobacteraceae bacterium]